ncbi:MAG: radical SAM protein [Bacteroidaceae bacterium]|nr:radical SAM protein [Bacteroidaceae bacterium]
MSTIIFPSPIFGPVHSRRLGVSLGINLLPADGKVCSFDCIYCECGYNCDRRPHSALPRREEVAEALERQLLSMKNANERPDVLTFAGNGEPTAHPDFPGIVDDTIGLRNKYFPEAKISVLSNATFIDREEVRGALMKVDHNILKLDTANAAYIQAVNRPAKGYSVERQIELMKLFRGHITIQTMFMHAVIDGKDVNNTEESYVGPWMEALKEIGPRQVMIYTIDRETPDHTLQKATHQELDAIVERLKALGFSATASY